MTGRFALLLLLLLLAQATQGLPHPKLQALTDVLLEHVQQQGADGGADAGGAERDVSRVIVFCSFRSQVELLQKHLQQHEPLIRAR